MQAPVTQLARGEQRKTTTLAISSGVPKRPIGMFSSTKRRIPSGSSSSRRPQEPPGKAVEPGACLVFPHAPLEVVGDADVEPLGSASEDVHVVGHGSWPSEEIPRCPDGPVRALGMTVRARPR